MALICNRIGAGLYEYVGRRGKYVIERDGRTWEAKYPSGSVQEFVSKAMAVATIDRFDAKGEDTPPPDAPPPPMVTQGAAHQPGVEKVIADKLERILQRATGSSDPIARVTASLEDYIDDLRAGAL